MRNEDKTGELLKKLKNEITKMNEVLFWGSEDSTKNFKYSEILEIKNLLCEAYEYINTQ